MLATEGKRRKPCHVLHVRWMVLDLVKPSCIRTNVYIIDASALLTNINIK